VSGEQREMIDTIPRQSAFRVEEQPRLLQAAVSAQPLTAEATETSAAHGRVIS
jgi:hypothetical protein